MCIAGVFGGKGSGTYETTKNVVLESAYFHPTWIRKSARRHGLSTDASFRFERGIDPNGVVYALKQAAILCKELAGGKISMDICDEYPTKMEDFPVRLNYEYCDRLIGKKLGNDTIKHIAESLEMKVLEEDTEGLNLLVPAYRVDVQRPCDVVEDILRIYGYNNVEIPTELKSSLTIAEEADKDYHRENIIGEQLVGEGFSEIMNNSLTKSSYYEETELNAYPWDETVKIMNPLSADLGVMRQTLLFGGLESIVRNINRKAQNLRFFEVGNVYKYNKEKWTEDSPVKAYIQKHHMALWVTGKHIQGSWAHPDEESSFYELKAYVENILRRIGIAQGLLVYAKSDNNIFDKAIALKTRAGKTLVEMGILAHKLLKRFNIEQKVYYAELDWTGLMKVIRKNKLQFHEISKYPAVSRDLALLVDNNVEFAQIEEIARQTDKKQLKRVELFDVYQGKNLPEGKKSYAVNFILQDETKTLNDKAIDAIMQKLIKNLTNKLGAELR
jgi:phenylalanine--tRNA ligase, beta subunit